MLDIVKRKIYGVIRGKMRQGSTPSQEEVAQNCDETSYRSWKTERLLTQKRQKQGAKLS